ncbi:MULTISPECIES: hypothetical protein [unclassified Carboxylicivirga]|uniref:hypothetical protein n=1 Tax=Carboxylicivirga TaxID=1628153 RepID=UPI003D352623
MRVLSLIMCLIPVLSVAGNIDTVREQFHGLRDAESLDRFLSMVKDVDDERVVPYREAANMKRARFTANPLRKMKYFNDGKEKLDRYISEHPKNIEGYYVRFLVQCEVPAFLGYNNHKASDRAFVESQLDASLLPDDYKVKIRQNIRELSQK